MFKKFFKNINLCVHFILIGIGINAFCAYVYTTNLNKKYFKVLADRELLQNILQSKDAFISQKLTELNSRVEEREKALNMEKEELVKLIKFIKRNNKCFSLYYMK